jgi:hypothetical protein
MGFSVATCPGFDQNVAYRLAIQYSKPLKPASSLKSRNKKQQEPALEALNWLPSSLKWKEMKEPEPADYETFSNSTIQNCQFYENSKNHTTLVCTQVSATRMKSR